MQVMLMRLMSKGEYVIVPKGTEFTGSGKLGLIMDNLQVTTMKSLHKLILTYLHIQYLFVCIFVQTRIKS